MAVVYGARSPPKFMVEILGSSFKFSTSTINFTAEFKIFYTLLLDFTSLENMFTLVFWLFNSTFVHVFDLARCTFSTRFVKLHS